MTENSNGPVDLESSFLSIDPEGLARAVEYEPGPPKRFEGLSIGSVYMTHEPPHAGEMHPDGDEIHVSGALNAPLLGGFS